MSTLPSASSALVPHKWSGSSSALQGENHEKGFLPLVKLELTQLTLNSYSKGIESRWLSVSFKSAVWVRTPGKLWYSLEIWIFLFDLGCKKLGEMRLKTG